MVDYQLLAYLETFLTERRNVLFKKVVSKRTRHFTVVTEDVFQLHNTSAVMRTCDIFGIQDLHVVEEIKGKRIDKEIALGAQKWVDLYRYDKIDSCLNVLKEKGYRIIATTPHEEALKLEDFDITQKAAFFFGKESSGLSDKVISKADEFLKIPMYGFTESLNISVSAAIILQDVVSKLRRSEIPWQLTEEEQSEKRLEWTMKSIKSITGVLKKYKETNNI
ncbi:MAG: rRNA methyltransferase [Flavobacteriaceae bacterium CG_4_8_14_3_um_filter_34_10]|nr:RNA methyltransferase [Flavobacteriia bacterium]OIP50809.1 MAG: rRNA methyltransferase [Flavobacteriaceae bacterium CG2_30_34_30]PIQ17596.1 MAG: rRNA methyltransferase [Flavobacteriaceae bacterium CG18_big_fil_WC_8_21_14_2_50_34_36]PIV49092.1 MAG: rRNA methyltransferase [Flavobacteriaceae bacterium CG02_land_8_20_14_3_00_34_13]PIX09428.1 MAG: rRNA methyltransferase [Flavobacteriaceae bacterium CG_4_8_14_3_um_filter_34_10]PIZ08460.1 MAG: rRNA methyltransferase [Flavobacteriaceae bacterium CG